MGNFGNKSSENKNETETATILSSDEQGVNVNKSQQPPVNNNDDDNNSSKSEMIEEDKNVDDQNNECDNSQPSWPKFTLENYLIDEKQQIQEITNQKIDATTITNFFELINQILGSHVFKSSNNMSSNAASASSSAWSSGVGYSADGNYDEDYYDDYDGDSGYGTLSETIESSSTRAKELQVLLDFSFKYIIYAIKTSSSSSSSYELSSNDHGDERAVSVASLFIQSVTTKTSLITKLILTAMENNSVFDILSNRLSSYTILFELFECLLSAERDLFLSSFSPQIRNEEISVDGNNNDDDDDDDKKNKDAAQQQANRLIPQILKFINCIDVFITKDRPALLRRLKAGASSLPDIEVITSEANHQTAFHSKLISMRSTLETINPPSSSSSSEDNNDRNIVASGNDANSPPSSSLSSSPKGSDDEIDDENINIRNDENDDGGDHKIVIEASEQSNKKENQDDLERKRKEYIEKLKDFAFDFSTGIRSEKHLFHVPSSEALSPTLLSRVVTEMQTLGETLPTCISYDSAAFLKIDEEDVSYMKLLIIGPSDTPYQNGCFEFDIKLPANYPASPPKANLLTTNNNSFRFNPNLYENGYICLSLLGTWSGSNDEKWNPELSSVLQLIMSIQTLIFVAFPYYNEPGYQFNVNDEASNSYNVNIKNGTTQYAIIDQIKNIKNSQFSDILRLHFQLKKEEIISQTAVWCPSALSALEAAYATLSS